MNVLLGCMAGKDCGRCGNNITVSDGRRYTVADRDAYSCSNCGESFIMKFNSGFVNESQALDESWISSTISPQLTNSSKSIKIFDSATTREEIAVAFLNDEAQKEDSTFMSFQASKNTILATRQGSAAGYIIWDQYHWEEGVTPRLLQIFVDKSHRRNGIGRIMLTHFEDTYIQPDKFFFVHNPGEEMYYLLAGTNHLEIGDDGDLLGKGWRWQGVTFDVPDDIADHV